MSNVRARANSRNGHSSRLNAGMGCCQFVARKHPFGQKSGGERVAGAGRVRPAYRIEGPGLDFGRDTDIPLERFDAVREALMSAEDWTRPYDGNTAFEEFLAAKPPLAATT